MRAANDARVSALNVYDAADVTFAYDGRGPLVLQGVNLVVNSGDFLGIVGPNGAGKSTLLNLLSGWLKPTSGKLLAWDRPLGEWSPRERARRVAVVPQHEDVVFDYTVQDVVLMGRTAHRAAVGLGFESDEDHRIATQAIDKCCLQGFEHRVVRRLSGGEQQRVLLARALAQQPEVLLLDEPSAGLDLAHQTALFGLIAELNAQAGVTVIAVMHDLNLAALYCRELAVLVGGRISARGTPAEVLTAERVEATYGVRVAVDRTPEHHPNVRLIR